MEWAGVSAKDALRALKRGARAVDVRSAGEFALGAVPGVVNLPILCDGQRHMVGLAFKAQGPAAALELGLEMVLPNREGLRENWRRALESCDESARLLLCWRGGLRSEIAGQWLQQSGFSGRRVIGGYKALRTELLAALAAPPRLLVLAGLTGAGKTELLQLLPRARIADLEGYANHRGSSFGLRVGTLQPAQQTFENELGLALFEPPDEVIFEAESRMIGHCAIPTPVKAAMDASPRIFLESSLEERVRRLYIEYVEVPLRHLCYDAVKEHLASALKRIERRLGGRRHQEIERLLQNAFSASELNLERHTPWIESLLREYYDPQYEFSNQSNEFLFRGDFAAVKDFLAHRFAGRRA